MYQYLLKHPECFPAVLGISKEQFDRVVATVHPILFCVFKTRAIHPGRWRTAGGGRKRVFGTDASLVLLILLYYKVYPTFRLAQVLFGLDKMNVWRWVEFMKPILQQALHHALVLPIRKVTHMGQLLTVCPDLQEFLVDATERRIQRPENTDIQQFYYSGKKKMHTVKNQILVNPRTMKILAVSKTVEGKRHDKKLAEDDGMLLRAPPGAFGMSDNGYQGGERINSTIALVYPTRKPKGKALTSRQKKTNRTIAQIRVRVEHVFASLKHFNIHAHTYRNTIASAHTPFVTLAALYNFTR
ncbi:MAG: transposase [Candidatus Pacebacteria bacterium]|nr:transposase [Candidatus Paceibacterota bacterium]